MTSNQHGFYVWGYTHDTMVHTKRGKTVMIRFSECPYPVKHNTQETSGNSQLDPLLF